MNGYTLNIFKWISMRSNSCLVILFLSLQSKVLKTIHSFWFGLKGLISGKTYYLVVTAVSKTGESSISDEISHIVK